MHNWAAEAARFTPDLGVRAITQTAARRGVDLAEAVGQADVVVTSYTLFRLEYDDYAAMDWAGLVLDEAQFVKNPTPPPGALQDRHHRHTHGEQPG